MDALRQAIYDTLVADSSITNNLAAYRSAYAISDGHEIPQDFPTPAVVYDIVSNVRSDTKNTHGFDIIVQIDCVGTINDSMVTLADNVVTLLHDNLITVTGYDTVMAIADGPVSDFSEDGFTTLTVNVRYIIDKTDS